MKLKVGMIVEAHYANRHTIGRIQHIIKAGELPSAYAIRRYYELKKSDKYYKGVSETRSKFDRIVIRKGNSNHFVIIPLHYKTCITPL